MRLMRPESLEDFSRISPRVWADCDRYRDSIMIEGASLETSILEQDHIHYFFLSSI